MSTTELVERLGVGGAMAWVALLILTLSTWRARETQPASREVQLDWVLRLSLGFMAVPWLHLPVSPATALPVLRSTGIERVVAAAAVHSGGRPVLWWVGMGWLAMVVVGIVQLALSLVRASLALRQSRPAPEFLVDTVRRLARRMGIPAPQVRVVGSAAMAFVARPWQPTLVVPRWALDTLDSESLELVLLHELNHLSRGDLGRGLLWALCRIPFTGHAAALWLDRERIHAREAEVDGRVDVVQEARYARLLVDFAERVSMRGADPTFVGMSAGSLTRRIEQLFAPRRRRAARWPVLTTAVVLAGLVLLVSPLASAAEDAPPPQESNDADRTESDRWLKAQEGAAELPRQTLHVTAAGQRFLHVEGMHTVSVADPSIADIHISQGDLVVRGTQPGTTYLIVYTDDGTRHPYEVVVD